MCCKISLKHSSNQASNTSHFQYKSFWIIIHNTMASAAVTLPCWTNCIYWWTVNSWCTYNSIGWYIRVSIFKRCIYMSITMWSFYYYSLLLAHFVPSFTIHMYDQPQSHDQMPFHIFLHLNCYIILNIRNRRIFFTVVSRRSCSMQEKQTIISTFYQKYSKWSNDWKRGPNLGVPP